MSTAITNNKPNGHGVVLVPPSAGEKILAKQLSDAEVKIKGLDFELVLAKGTNLELEQKFAALQKDFDRKVKGLQKSFDFQADARMSYEEAYHRWHAMYFEAERKLAKYTRMPSWMVDLGCFVADLQDVWTAARQKAKELRQQAHEAIASLQGWGIVKAKKLAEAEVEIDRLEQRLKELSDSNQELRRRNREAASCLKGRSR